MASGSGYPSTEASCSGCSSFSKKGDGKYIATVKSGKEATITVHGIGSDGSKTQIAQQVFRIKRLPDPTPKIVGVGVEASTVKIGKIKQAKKLLAELKGSPLNIKFTITKFTVSVVKNGEDRKSTRLELQSHSDLVCRLLLEKKKKIKKPTEKKKKILYKNKSPR